MIRFSLIVLLAAAALGARPLRAESGNDADASVIRAGRNIAMTTCVSCHVVSPDQAIKPVLGPGIPSFQEVANRPDTTVDSLRAAMKVARWHDPAMAATLLPMSRISDTERAQVARYILSLRERR